MASMDAELSTVVLPAHRGRGIGRGMKAAMWQRLKAGLRRVL